MAKITVSFKNTTKDMKLFALIKNMEEQSEFFKTAALYYLKYLSEEKLKQS